MNNGQKSRGTEKVNFVERFIPFGMNQLQRVYKSIKFLETESNRNANKIKSSIEIKSKMKQVKAEGVLISNALGLD